MLHSTMKSRLTGSPMKFRRMILFVLFVLLVGGLYVWQERQIDGTWISTSAKPTATEAYGGRSMTLGIGSQLTSNRQ